MITGPKLINGVTISAFFASVILIPSFMLSYRVEETVEGDAPSHAVLVRFPIVNGRCGCNGNVASRLQDIIEAQTAAAVLSCYKMTSPQNDYLKVTYERGRPLAVEKTEKYKKDDCPYRPDALEEVRKSLANSLSR